MNDNAQNVTLEVIALIKNRKAENIHDKLLIFQIINYKKQGYTDIKVNHSNYIHGLPDKVGGYTPDLSAILNNKVIICRVVTNDSLNNADTLQQWKAFSQSSYEFHIILPKSFLTEVKELAKSNGITVDKFWYSKNV